MPGQSIVGIATNCQLFLTQFDSTGSLASFVTSIQSTQTANNSFLSFGSGDGSITPDLVLPNGYPHCGLGTRFASVSRTHKAQTFDAVVDSADAEHPIFHTGTPSELEGNRKIDLAEFTRC